MTLNADGSFAYNPQGFAGQATFTYQIDDQTQLSNPVTVTLVVNTLPVAAADTFQVAEDTPLTTTAATGVLANDSDADGNALTAIIEALPTHGQLTFNANGSFVYVPEANYHGTDAFSYRVTDGIDTTTAALAQISVQSVNDAPVASDDFYFALPGNPLSISAAFGLLTNDTDVETSNLSAALVTAPTHGQVNLATDGSFTYTANAGFTGTDSFPIARAMVRLRRILARSL